MTVPEIKNLATVLLARYVRAKFTNQASRAYVGRPLKISITE